MSNDLVIWQEGFVKGFKLIPYKESLFSSILGFYEGSQVEFCIRRKKKKVSAASHGYYRGILLPLCLSSNIFGGWRINDIHDFFAEQFLKDVKELAWYGKTIFVKSIKSTSDINQEEMNRFIEDVRQFMEEHDIKTPEPIKKAI